MRFGELNLVWKQVYKSIEEASRIVAVGFSFCDPHFNAVLAKAIGIAKAPKPVVVVNPQPNALEEIQERLRAHGLETIPFSGTLSDFVGCSLNK